MCLLLIGIFEKDICSRIAMGKKAFMDKRKLFEQFKSRLMEKNYQMHCLECGTLCSRDLDSDKKGLEASKFGSGEEC